MSERSYKITRSNAKIIKVRGQCINWHTKDITFAVTIQTPVRNRCNTIELKSILI
jgi:hypothetical protein